MGSNLASVVNAVRYADEHKEGLEKVLAYLKNLDPTQLRSTKQSESMAIFQLCHYWGIRGHEAEIFHHYSEKGLAEENVLDLAFSTNSAFLLNKVMRGFFQRAAQSEDDYDHALELLIKREPLIEKLDLSDLDLSDSLMKLLKPCQRQLKELNLSGNNQLTDKGIAYLTKLQDITSLNLSGTKLTNEGLESLKAFSELNSLDITRCSLISKTQIKEFMKALPDLRCLYSYVDPEVEERLIQACEKQDQGLLEQVVIDLLKYAALSDKKQEAVKSLLQQYSPPLEKLDLKGSHLDGSVLGLLKELKDLKNLNLEGC